MFPAHHPPALPALGRTTLSAGVLLAGLLAFPAAGQPGVAVQVDGVAVEELLIDGPGETLDDVLGVDSQPGFAVMRGEDTEQIAAALNAFHENLDAEQWETAFRSLIDLSESTRHMMAPLGDSPVYVPIRRSIQHRLYNLPPQGRRAFQQFYDAQAREMLSRCQGHDRPGSDEQLALAQELFELFLMTSSGDAAANLLGDLYYERGQFDQAQRCWESVLTYHPGSSLPEVGLQFKRVMALHRAGRATQAHELAQQVALRFAGRDVAYGGEQTDAAMALQAILGAPPQDVTALADAQARVPAALPERGSGPSWQMTFVDDAAKAQLDQFLSGRNYYGPTDLRELVAPALADDRAVYAHWHGVVFAMDLDTGKLLWRTGSFTDAARQMTARMGTAAGNPRGYKIAQTDDLVLVQSAGQGNARQNDRFTLVGYDKQTGEVRWDSDAHPTWRGLSFCGQPIVINDQLYAITHGVGGMAANEAGLPAAGNNRELTLHRLDPATGAPSWSLPLGEADVRAMANVQSVWMPQPLLQQHGRDLIVLTNNGAVLSVDLSAGEVAWAIRLIAPEGLANQNNYYVQQAPGANAQGPGGMAVLDGVLYVKEARSRRMYAIDPIEAQLLWERDAPADAELIGVDRDHLYTMAQAVRAYPLDPEARLAWNNNQISGPSIGSGLLADDALYVLGGNKLRALSLGNGDPVEQFSSRNLRGRGGRIFMAGDRVVCVTHRDITVFPVPTEPAPVYQADDDTPGESP